MAALSVAALVRPLPRLGMATRRRALGGLGWSAVMFVAAGVVIGSSADSSGGKEDIASFLTGVLIIATLLAVCFTLWKIMRASYRLGTRLQPKATNAAQQPLTFRYRNVTGAETLRTVMHWTIDPNYITGTCLEADGERTFRRDRVIEWIGTDPYAKPGFKEWSSQQGR